MAQRIHSLRGEETPRVVFFAFASCFGCQLQVTNKEAYLLDVLGQIDLRYWQLVSDAPLPQDFDIAVIEGAVTTEEAAQLLRQIRQRARVVVGIGACALTGGIPSMAGAGFEDYAHEVYGDALPEACGHMRVPASIKNYIDVDFEVPCCPVDFNRFVDVLQQALYGSNKLPVSTTLCGECKVNGTQCLYEQGHMCLGLVTRTGCGARCPKLGRACNGCAGLSPDCNVDAAYVVVEAFGQDLELFKQRLRLFNTCALDQAQEETNDDAEANAAAGGASTGKAGAGAAGKASTRVATRKSSKPARGQQ